MDAIAVLGKFQPLCLGPSRFGAPVGAGGGVLAQRWRFRGGGDVGLPSVCNAPANVSNCPALLHMDPNSPEAQVFYQFGNSSSHSASTPSSSPVPSAQANAPTGSSTGTSDGHFSGTRWWGLEAVFVGGLIMWLFSSHSIICIM
ncbi:hypothetical protein Vadar_028697 [Vaccinium darrowii]|uniref:Uncharacterized protein n=1 Tax=Vaccinium darrowii TaxID=229202 RepID=A0ACB7ZF13_9ERIC|nr:hypothetical protein Vadar_028697 [Vaccinium darrowii]